MIRSLLFLLVASATFVAPLRARPAPASPTAQSPAVCTAAWYRWVDRHVRTADADGHGPDVGSSEWKSSVEFRLGLRGQAQLPERDSPAWCRFIDARVRARIAHAQPMPAAPAPTDRPSFACDKAAAGSTEALICGDPALAAMDRELARVYAAAADKADARMRPQLRAEQRGWIKGRDDCWKSEDRPACVRSAYQQRIAELQARYRLVASQGPQFFTCNGRRADEVVLTFFATRPRTLIAERGDRSSLMYAASPTLYQGRNERIALRGNRLTLVWGHAAAPMQCIRASR
ncbi:lysozyme inhibitor LprI family protein [Oleiagrimonas soli]|uniref:Lysozyme inhibitor LprI-like N-terminal domain-containing protein n=1 Tax=Oleiagrimonas soli TaxID=1543381 RepID=A0A099D0L5_9GAMM|nr:lysozyme inhibitor LprI family protein [Oleiagrimonas soli]KGI78835.1 hypothetical protein LF63_0102550 [Oleiagrimonas soli]MBB6184375.1 uncharacterized protein [Oleiagrimonas soli]